jgi:hypothetical protein
MLESLLTRLLSPQLSDEGTQGGYIECVEIGHLPSAGRRVNAGTDADMAAMEPAKA